MINTLQQHTPPHTTQLPIRKLSNCITANYNRHGCSAVNNTLWPTQKYGRSLTLWGECLFWIIMEKYIAAKQFLGITYTACSKKKKTELLL